MPAGYVSRITLLVEQKVGATLEEFCYKKHSYHFWNKLSAEGKSIVKDSIDVVTGANDDDDDDSDTEGLTGYLLLINSKTKIITPSALNTDTTVILIKLRKIYICHGRVNYEYKINDTYYD
ncbi:hypothetical protein BDC45DRAFT_576282 [Circinella umbellata]|nr:hypothetical protein BDC45DRAFT_576282 [Circinella umbellata]